MKGYDLGASKSDCEDQAEVNSVVVFDSVCRFQIDSIYG